MLACDPLERIVPAEHSMEESLDNNFDVLLTKLREEHERVKQEKKRLLLEATQQNGGTYQHACPNTHEDLLAWLPPVQPRLGSRLHCEGEKIDEFAAVPPPLDACHQHDQDAQGRISMPPLECRSGHDGGDRSCEENPNQLSPSNLSCTNAQLQGVVHADSVTYLPIRCAATDSSVDQSPRGPMACKSKSSADIQVANSNETETAAKPVPFKKYPKSSRLSNLIRTASIESSCEVVSHHTFRNRFLDIQESITNASASELVEAALDPFMNAIVVLNILMIGVSADTKEWIGWRFIDMFFLIVFSMEILVRLKLVGLAYLCGPDRLWNLLDILLVGVAAADFGVSNSPTSNEANIGAMRLLRLCRLGRIVRMLRSPYAKEFMELVGGMTGGTRTLMWSIALMMLPVYVLGILFVEIVAASGTLGDLQKYFSSVPVSMYTLVRCMLGDCSDSTGKPLSLLLSDRYGWSMGLFYCFYMWISITGLFNLISAIFVQNALASSKLDDTFQQRVRVREQAHVMKHIQELLILFWSMVHKENSRRGVSILAAPRGTCSTTASGGSYKALLKNKADMIAALEECKYLSITHELYQELVGTQEGQRIFQNLGLSNDMDDLFDILDPDSTGELRMHELVEGIQQLRGHARRSDLVSLGYTLRALQSSNLDAHKDQSTLLASIKKSVDIFNKKDTQRRPPRDKQSADFVPVT